MNRLKFVSVLLFVSVVSFSQNPRFNLYPNLAVGVGGTIPFPVSDIPNGAEGRFKLSPNVGIGARYELNERWRFVFEINYHSVTFLAKANVVSQPFYYDDGTPQYFTGKTKTYVELKMIEFPFLLFYKLKQKQWLSFGLYYSDILKGRFETEGINGIYSTDKEITDNAILPGPELILPYNFNSSIDKYDFGILIGYCYDINSRLSLWSKLSVGFKSVFEREFESINYKMYQVRFNLGASFDIFN
ncbi:MAG: outer membrane beta-barrel protein [Bacteroidales bacterium]|nr:outer membrane beta-barrel protein [Bacteroidales bacterium]